MPYRPPISPDFGESLVSALEADGCFSSCGTIGCAVVIGGLAIVIGLYVLLPIGMILLGWVISTVSQHAFWVAGIVGAIVLVFLLRRR